MATTTYYVDPTASGSTEVGTQANPWLKLQDGFDGKNGVAPNGDVNILCKHTNTPDETITVAIDMDQGEGVAATYYKIIGVNSSWVNDGTRYVINADSPAANVILHSGARDFVWYENLEMYGATGDGWDNGANYTVGLVFVNCYSHDNGAGGFDCYYASGTTTFPWVFFRCSANLNTGMGFDSILGGLVFIDCEAIDNTSHGWTANTAGYNLCIGCIAHSNGNGGTGDGFKVSEFTALINCISDGNVVDGVDCAAENLLAIACRFTANGVYGVDCSGGVLEALNLYLTNGTAARDGAQFSMTVDGTDYNLTAGTEGYAGGAGGGAGHDFNLTTDATNRAVAVEIE